MTHQVESKLSKACIIEDLQRMGVKRGDHLALGASYKRIGQIEGGPGTLIEALIEVVGPDGTIMANTYTKYFYISEVRNGWIDYIFDAESTRSTTGIVAETLRQFKGAIRSRHPAYSIAAIGKHARFLTGSHDEHAPSFSPYSLLAGIDGKYLAIGIGDKLAGFRHQAQYAAGLLNVVPGWERAVRYRNADGEIRTFVLKDRGGCVNSLPRLVPFLREAGLVTQGRVGMADAIIVPAEPSLNLMTRLLEEQPQLNLCEKTFCPWCRGIERRLDLYHSIQNPRFFQKNKAAAALVALINRIREVDSNTVVRLKRISHSLRRSANNRKSLGRLSVSASVDKGMPLQTE